MKSLVHITSYSLKSSFNPVNHSFHLLGWDLMGSLNGRQWDILDSRKNANEINRNGCEYNFTPLKCGIYRYFRLKQTQKRNESETFFYFRVRRIEFYGSMFPNDYINRFECTLPVQKNVFHIKLFFSILLQCQ
jgi:hypothetical protein